MTGPDIAADSMLRPTGIPIVAEIPWGTHICVFYETKNDLLDMAAAYFAAGLDSNEFCIWAASPPIHEEDAKDLLRSSVPNFDERVAAGQIEILQGYAWYLKGNEFDPQRIIGGWKEKLNYALTNGYVGMRVSGNAFWFEANLWREFSEYEQEIHRALAELKMIAMCTYSLKDSRAFDVLDVARAHDFTAARRKGHWEFLETPEIKRAKLKRLKGALDMSNPFPGSELLTGRERDVLAQLVTGATSKEAGRVLGISPRTIDFHRADIMRRLGAKNLADLVRKVLSE
jgi:DNA-binding CsgD family transcriptional regulator